MAKVLSTEDKDLSSISLAASRKRLYSDIDLTLARNTSNDNDIYKKKDAAAVKQAIKTLIQTNRLEKPFRPEFGADLRSMFFELVDDATGNLLEEQIYNTISRYEPRVKVRKLDVNLKPDNNSLAVRLEFQVINTEQIETFETTITRLR